MKKIGRNKDKQENLEDTLEFLSLDDETIEAYRRETRISYDADEEEDEDYESEDYEDEEIDEDYESEDYEDEEEDEDYESEDYEDEEIDEDYESEDYEDEEIDEDYESEDYEDEEIDEDYESEDYEDEEDEDYEDEEYEDEEEDEDYEYEDNTYQGNFFGKILHTLANFTALDYVVAVFGCFILVVAVIVGKIYLSARATDKQVEAFAEIGTEMDDVEVIGESGLIAVSNAESARLSQMLDMEENPEEQTEQKPEDDSQTAMIEVGIHITSIKSDIKIKLVNKKTNKLIGSVPFEVEVTGNSKTFSLKDEDKDGVIYKNDIDAGTYSVKVVALTDEAYSKYLFPSKAETITVLETIEYKKVDVEDEIKTEAEINVAVEDTAKQETVVESVLTDTVEWVESKKVEINPDSNYQEINASDIPDPATIAKAAGFMKFSATDPSVSDNNPDPGNTSTGSTSTDSTNTSNNSTSTSTSSTSTGGTDNPQSPVYTLSDITGPSSIAKGSTGTVTISTNPEGGKVAWSSSNTGVVTVDENGVLKAVAAGKADIIATCGAERRTFAVVVTEVYTGLKIEGDSVLKVGQTGKVTGTTTPPGGSITWTSSNTGVVTVDGNGSLKAVAPGEATITGTGADNVSATWTVKVIKDVSGDTTSKLKDKNGTQIYIRTSEGKYVEAVYADYYTNTRFYLKKADAVYSYTGWQTIDGYTYFFDKNGNFVTGDQVIQGAKYSFDSAGRLSSGSGVLGIDVSKWNGNIDWNAVRNSGISYAVIRCGYRGSTTGALIEDPKFRANIQGAQNAGIRVGVYFFTQAVNDVEAVEEASMVLSLIKGYNLALPVFLDVEATSGHNGRADGISVEARTAVCSAFCQTIQNSGYKAGVYANTTWLNSFINTPALTGYKIWLAQYAAVPTYTRTRIDMWQYTSKGTIGGINGNVDMNISYMN